MNVEISVWLFPLVVLVPAIAGYFAGRWSWPRTRRLVVKCPHAECDWYQVVDAMPFGSYLGEAHHPDTKSWPPPTLR